MEFLTISSTKFVQKITLNLMLIKPGLTTDILSINLSFFLIASVKIAARSVGDFLFILDKTIATLVEISLSNFEGGISVVIPSNFSGKIKSPFLARSNKIFFILSEYWSKMFIEFFY